jgi:hypothetical protein
MKKKALKFLIGLFVTFVMITTGCKKDSIEDADKFVGNYSYIMTLTISGQSMSQNGDLTIKKTSANKITITQAEGGSPTSYTVSGNSITEDGGQTVDIPIAGGGTASFLESSTGILNGIVITINGTYTRTGYITPTFTVVLTKK